MSRVVKSQKEVAVTKCMFCDYYDETIASSDMRKLYLCTDPKNQKISDKKSDTYIWFESLCTYPCKKD